MKLIALTSIHDHKTIWINPEHIGHLYAKEAKMEYGRIQSQACTRVGVTTHNNGGFEVKETPEEIIALISKSATI